MADFSRNMYVKAHDDEDMGEFKKQFMDEPASHEMELVHPPLGIHVSRLFFLLDISVFSPRSL